MKKLILILMSVVLGACTHHATPVTNDVILDHREDYMGAKNGRNLVVPQPMSDDAISHQFDIAR